MTLCLINKEYVIFTTVFNGIEIEVELGQGKYGVYINEVIIGYLREKDQINLAKFQ